MLSIIIPAHNPGPFLRMALESVRAQTFRDWELLVVDDHSSEDLQWIGRDVAHIRYLRQSHGGVSVARNNGILKTSGEFVAFMDQDDLWRPDKLRRQIVAMQAEPAAAVCYCDLEMIGADTTLEQCSDGEANDMVPIVELDGSTSAAAGDGVSNLLRSLRHFSKRFIVPSTVMIRRSALATSGLLDPFIPFSGDFDLLIKLGSRHKVIRVPSADVLYRKHANNFSDQYDVGRREVKALTARYVAYAESTGDRRLAKEAPKLFGRPRRLYAAQAFDRARYSFRQKQYRTLIYHWLRAVMFSPTYSLGSSLRWMLAGPASRKAD